jgi:hypothetical protein
MWDLVVFTMKMGGRGGISEVGRGDLVVATGPPGDPDSRDKMAGGTSPSPGRAGRARGLSNQARGGHPGDLAVAGPGRPGPRAL